MLVLVQFCLSAFEKPNHIYYCTDFFFLAETGVFQWEENLQAALFNTYWWITFSSPSPHSVAVLLWIGCSCIFLTASSWVMYSFSLSKQTCIHGDEFWYDSTDLWYTRVSFTILLLLHNSLNRCDSVEIIFLLVNIINMICLIFFFVMPLDFLNKLRMRTRSLGVCAFTHTNEDLVRTTLEILYYVGIPTERKSSVHIQ